MLDGGKRGHMTAMDDIEGKYALLGLTEETRACLMELRRMNDQPQRLHTRLVVETVVLQDGQKTVIEREERSA